MDTSSQKCAYMFAVLCALSIMLKIFMSSMLQPMVAKKTQTLVWSHNSNQTRHHESLRNAQFRDLRPFLASTESGVTLTKPPIYLTDVKNPCFALMEGYINVGNISVMTALDMNLEIRCLPAVYITGFPGCGTDTLYRHLTKHPLLRSVNPKPPDYSQIPSGVNKNMYREGHFWDNTQCIQNQTMDQFTRRFPFEPIRDAFRKFGLGPTNQERANTDFREMVYVEYAPRIAYHGDSWTEDTANWKASQPYYLVVNRVRWVTPTAKLIFLVCEPVSRTFRDYQQYAPTAPEPIDDFHNKMKIALAWWQRCTASRMLVRNTCAYGLAPMSFPFHNTLSCGTLGLAPAICPGKGEFTHWGCGNAVDRLRLSIYHIYIGNWAKTFKGMSQIHVVTAEDMKADLPSSLVRAFKFLELGEIQGDFLEMLWSLNSWKNSGETNEMEKVDRRNRKILQEFFRPENEKLALLIGHEGNIWDYGDNDNA